MRESLTYGTLPTREEFEEAFDAEIAQPETGWARFTFGNDPRVGTVEMTASELWGELEGATMEWEGGHPECKCDGARVHSGDHAYPCWEASGQWCSDVLGVLGFEWV